MKTLKNSFALYLSIVCFFFFAVTSCTKEASCSDGIQNQGETGIDCFVDGDGPCPQCETQPNYNPGGNPNDTTDTVVDTTDNPVDTTGNGMPNDTMDTTDTTDNSMCSAKMCAVISGLGWEAATATANYELSSLTISGQASDQSAINISSFGLLEPGSISITPDGAQSIIYNSGTVAYTTKSPNSSGTFTITAVDDVNKTISGTFDMVAYTPDGVDSIHLNSGTYTELIYE